MADTAPYRSYRRRVRVGGRAAVAVGLAAVLAMAGWIVTTLLSSGYRGSLRGVTSATITHTGDVTGDGRPVQLPADEARRLAPVIDALPKERSGDQSCGDDTGARYRIHFARGGSEPVDVTVDDGGCLGVHLATGHRAWDDHPWDPDGTLRALLAHDLHR